MRSPTSQSGFTMIELLVTMGIFMVLTGVVLANYRSFNTNAVFANASEDVVLALRQAQIYGVSSKGGGVPCGASSFECAYGVYFSTGAPNGFKVFIDVNDDKVYKAVDDIVIDSIAWSNNIAVSSLFCGGTSCTSGEMSVTFKRPNPDAFITDALGASNRVDNGIITLKDAKNTNKFFTVTITSAGQISIQQL